MTAESKSLLAVYTCGCGSAIEVHKAIDGKEPIAHAVPPCKKWEEAVKTLGLKEAADA